MSFIDLCLSADVTEDEISAFVDNWHEDQETSLALHEYLGMHWNEYSVWATHPSILPSILDARRQGKTLDVVLNQGRSALAV